MPINNTMEIFFNVLVTGIWLCTFIVFLYLAKSWLDIYKEIDNQSVRLISRLFPIFLFKTSVLSETGQYLRKRILLFLSIFILLFASAGGVIYVKILLLGPS